MLRVAAYTSELAHVVHVPGFVDRGIGQGGRRRTTSGTWRLGGVSAVDVGVVAHELGAVRGERLGQRLPGGEEMTDASPRAASRLP
jgi:hypothetical protein